MSAYNKSKDIVSHRLPDGNLALADTSSGVMVAINSIGEAVWLLADECPSLDAVAAEIADEMQVPLSQVIQDVQSFSQSLREHGLIR